MLKLFKSFLNFLINLSNKDFWLKDIMSQENIEQQLILNDSLKDSIEQPPNAVPHA